MPLIVVGNIPVDVVMRVAALPAAGEDIVAESVTRLAGGALNVLFAARQAGLMTSYAGSHGVGPNGDLVRAALGSVGCGIIQPMTGERDTGMVVVLVEATGERTLVSAPDAVAPYDAEMLARIQPRQSDLVYVSGYNLGLGVLSAPLAAWVTELPTTCLVFCDLGPQGAQASAAILDPVLARMDWVSCNASEAAQVTGRSEPKVACDELRRRSATGGALVRVGADGCWLALPGGDAELVPSPSIGPVVDTTGAGDTHSGYFLAGLAAGRTPHDAVVMANTAAAISVTHHGPATAPRRTEVAALLR